MSGYDTNDGYVKGPLDDRDADDPEFRVDETLSCSNTDFGGDDPAKDTASNGAIFE